MKKRLTLSMFLVFGAISVQAQTVITTSGDFFSNSTAELSWTLGEIMGETYTTGTVHLTQGQQQTMYDPDPTGSFIIEESVELDLYPNPAQDHITLISSEPTVSVSFIDSRGALVKTLDLNQSNPQIDLFGLERGIYYLNVYSTNQQLLKIFKVVKL